MLCDTLLPADIFENFRTTCIEIYELDPTYFLSAPGLAWQACLKKTRIKSELLTDINMLLMVEKGISGGICHAIQKHVEANKKYMKNYDKYKESSYLTYLDANNLHGWAMSQKLPANDFKWITDMSIFDEEFIKNYDENIDKGYILDVTIDYTKNLHDFHGDLSFLPEKMKINKCNKLVCSLYDKKIMLST